MRVYHRLPYTHQKKKSDEMIAEGDRPHEVKYSSLVVQ